MYICLYMYNIYIYVCKMFSNLCNPLSVLDHENVLYVNNKLLNTSPPCRRPLPDSCSVQTAAPFPNICFP